MSRTTGSTGAAEPGVRPRMMAFGLAIHILAAVTWVGGMAFAYFVLRPATGPLDAPSRLALWHRVFARFLPMVWVDAVALLASGYAMLMALGGFARAGIHVHVMQASGIAMVLAFLHLY